MELRSLVNSAPTTCDPETPLLGAIQLMRKLDIGALPVVVDEELVGILTERDVISALASEGDVDGTVVADWMTASPDTLSPDTDVMEAAEWMLAAGYRHIPIVADGKILGLVSIKDVLWAVTEPIAQYS